MVIRVLVSLLPESLDEYDHGEWSGAAASRIRKVQRKHRCVDRVRSHLADHLLNSLAGTTVGYTRRGQPTDHSANFHLSASHDGEWVAAARSDGSIGIDVVDTRRTHLLPATVFDDSEKDHLAACPEPSIPRMAAAIWSAKEAHAKRLGNGFTSEPHTLVTRPYPAHLEVSDGERHSLVRILTLDTFHTLAVTFDTPDQEIQLDFAQIPSGPSGTRNLHHPQSPYRDSLRPSHNLEKQ